ncbi:hypothetical protein EG328_003397 [Venturia inaequalis]|uniref:Uncharacterized protein n=1 Tax=Venturia inaequalis TaxID=5025 RepID=A0A8H3Z6J6_VENIN|nr:hypothetical protein EG328_003397 [Venturia inaequalis]
MRAWTELTPVPEVSEEEELQAVAEENDSDPQGIALLSELLVDGYEDTPNVAIPEDTLFAEILAGWDDVLEEEELQAIAEENDSDPQGIALLSELLVDGYEDTPNVAILEDTLFAEILAGWDDVSEEEELQDVAEENDTGPQGTALLSELLAASEDTPNVAIPEDIQFAQILAEWDHGTETR